jgi:hypothetical protein
MCVRTRLSGITLTRVVGFVVVGGLPVPAYPWVQRERLAASPAGAFGEFGGAVAATAEGETLLIGAPGADNGTGGAWVYQRAGNLWPVQQRLSPEAAEQEDRFGASVALHGDTALVGAPWDDANRGTAWFYNRTGAVWTRDSALAPTAAEPGEIFFGQAVALTHGSALVGAPLADAPASLGGAADMGLVVFYALAPPTAGIELREGTATGPQVYPETTYNQGGTARLKPRTNRLVLTNPGNIPLVITELTADGDFSVPAAPVSVPAFGTAAFDLRMGADTAGAKTGRLTLRSNATGQPLFEVSLVGVVFPLPEDAPADADADGIADFYENAYLGTLSLLSATGDYDGDGVSDLDEFIAYSDATDAADRLRVVAFETRVLAPTGGGTTTTSLDEVTLTWTSRPERVYWIEWSADLASWVRLDGAAQVGAIGQSSRTFTLPAAARRVYRVVAEIP